LRPHYPGSCRMMERASSGKFCSAMRSVACEEGKTHLYGVRSASHVCLLRSRSRDSISGRRLLSQTAFSNVVVAVGLCGVGVTTFVDADAARAAPRSATCSILPARPRSRENHARTLFHGCDASPEAPEEEEECGTVSTVSIFGGEGGGGG